MPSPLHDDSRHAASPSAPYHAQPVVEPVAYAVELPSRPVLQSSCLRDILDVVLLAVCPCEPMARASSRVGLSYVDVLLTVALVYGGGIACLVASQAVDDPIFDLTIEGAVTAPLAAVLVAWILNIVGAVPSAGFVVFGWGYARAAPSFDNDPDTVFHASDASMALVWIFVGWQFVFLVVVGYLRHEILVRSDASSCCASYLGGFCFTLFLPCCSFAEAMQRARVAQDEQLHPYAPRADVDRLPGYAV